MSPRQCRKCGEIKAASEFYGPTRHVCRACRSRQVMELHHGLRLPKRRVPRPTDCPACGHELRRGKAGGVLVCECQRRVKPVAEQTPWERWAVQQTQKLSARQASGWARWRKLSPRAFVVSTILAAIASESPPIGGRGLVLPLRRLGLNAITAVKTSGNGGQTRCAAIAAKIQQREQAVMSSPEGHGRTKARDLLHILAAQDYRCALSGQALTPSNTSADHIVPVCRGGTNAENNAQIVTKEINRAKGTMTNEEFINMCRLVVEHTQRGRKEEET